MRKSVAYVTVNVLSVPRFPISVGYGQSSTPQTVAQALATAISSAGAGVTAAAASGAITVTANQGGTAGERRVPEQADEFQAALNGCLRDVLSRVEGCQDSFRELASHEQADLLIGVLANSVPPLIIDGDLLNRMASLRLRNLEIDLII